MIHRMNVKRELRFWWSVITWPFVVLWYDFVDYVWPTLWKLVVSALAGILLGIMVRFFYLGESTEQIWHTITSLFTG